MQQLRDRINSPRAHVLFNQYALILWIVLLIPTLVWWKESIVWLVFMSWYANTVGHWSGFTSAKAEEKLDKEE